MRKAAIIAVVIAVLAVALLFGYPRLLTHRIDLTVYFQNANGLRAGAPVRLAGVDVGTVTSVRARPEMQAAPAEVMLQLRTPYELRIPNDSTVSLATAGVLGEPFAEINVTGTSGPPVKNGGILKGGATNVPGTEELIRKLGDVLQRTPCTPQSNPPEHKSR